MKLIGILILLVAGVTLIGLFFGAVTFGFFGMSEAMWTEFMLDTPMDSNLIWLATVLGLIVVGIPFIFLFILGLKILMPRVKSTGRTPNLVLLGLWIIALLGLIFIGVKQATSTAFEGEVVERQELPVTSGDTLYISMQGTDYFESNPYRSGDISKVEHETLGEVIYKDQVRFLVRSTRDATGHMEIRKVADGHSKSDARQRASAISYSASIVDNELLLDGFLTTPTDQKVRNQEVVISLYLPEGSVIRASNNTNSFHRNSSRYNDILESGDEEKFLLITSSGTRCLDCEEQTEVETEASTDATVNPASSQEAQEVQDPLDSTQDPIIEEDPWSEPYQPKRDSL